MVDDVGELLLHIVNGFSLLHTKHFILLDQRVLPSTFDIVSSFVSHTKNLPHFTCTCMDKDPVKLIKG